MCVHAVGRDFSFPHEHGERHERRRLQMKKSARNRHRTMRFTPEEDEAIEQLAKASGVGFSTLVRACIRIAFRVPTQEEANIRGFTEAITQLNRTGNNLNQLARKVNCGQVEISDSDSRILKETMESVSKLRTTFETYEKLAKKRDLHSEIESIKT